MLLLILLVLAEEDTQGSHLSHQEQAGRKNEKETARAGMPTLYSCYDCIRVRGMAIPYTCVG